MVGGSPEERCEWAGCESICSTQPPSSTPTHPTCAPCWGVSAMLSAAAMSGRCHQEGFSGIMYLASSVATMPGCRVLAVQRASGGSLFGGEWVRVGGWAGGLVCVRGVRARAGVGHAYCPPPCPFLLTTLSHKHAALRRHDCPTHTHTPTCAPARTCAARLPAWTACRRAGRHTPPASQCPGIQGVGGGRRAGEGARARSPHLAHAHAPHRSPTRPRTHASTQPQTHTTFPHLKVDGAVVMGQGGDGDDAGGARGVAQQRGEHVGQQKVSQVVHP